MHKIFSFNRKKFKKIVNIGEEITKIISCKLKFINSIRFMTSSLLNFVNNLAEGIHKIKSKYRHGNKKKYESCSIKCKNCECYLEYTNIKDVSIV